MIVLRCCCYADLYDYNLSSLHLCFQNNTGILAMLDEECLRPGDVSDTTFLNKLNQTCSAHPHYESRGCRKTQSDRTLPHDAFRLLHYAGTVSATSYYANVMYIMKINSCPFHIRFNIFLLVTLARTPAKFTPTA
jgi:Myosin head (motor domain)